jgi:hypothetical protein
MTSLQKTVLRDDKEKNSLLIGLNIRITELYVKQKGGIETGSSEWDNQKIGILRL